MRYVFFIILLFAGATVYAQGNVWLKVIPSDKDTSFLTKDFSYKRNWPDTLSRTLEMKRLLSNLYRAGFLEATFIKSVIDSNRLSATLYTGKQWEWASLSNGNADEVILDRIGFREKLYNGKPFSSAEVSSLLNELLAYCENNGYPFAAVRLDSLKVEDQQLSAKIFMNKNRLITIDSIEVKGDARISNKYLSN